MQRKGKRKKDWRGEKGRERGQGCVVLGFRWDLWGRRQPGRGGANEQAALYSHSLLLGSQLLLNGGPFLLMLTFTMTPAVQWNVHTLTVLAQECSTRGTPTSWCDV